MQILGFYSTPDRARSVRDEMLSSGFVPLEVGIYGGADTPATERQAWFTFAQPVDRQLYREATRRGATAVVVELARQPAELADGEVAIEILERYGPVDVALWARDWAGGDPSATAYPPVAGDAGPIADWQPAAPLAAGSTIRRGIRCHREEDAVLTGDTAAASGLARFIREFAASLGNTGRDGNLVESDLRRQFASHYPGTDWASAKDQLQREYDRVRSSATPPPRAPFTTEARRD
jgi:hypothetical protein